MGHRRIGSALPVVIAALGDVEEMIDHAAGKEPVSLAVKIEAPRIARPFREKFELLSFWMITPDGTGEIVLRLRRL